MATENHDVLFAGPSGTNKRFRFMEDETHAEVVSTRDETERAFESGWSFRAFYAFNIPQNEERIIKVVSTRNTVVRLLQVELTAQSIDFQLKSGGTEGGTFSTNIAVQQSNNMTTVPTRSAGVTMTTGGTHTGGTVIDEYAATTTNQAGFQTISDTLALGFGPGTFYLRFDNTGNNAATGFFRARWDERP